MTNCFICNSSLELILNLGEQSLANALLDSKDNISEKFFLRLARCNSCGHIQLQDKIDPAKLFSKYLWVTGTSKTAKEFSYALKDRIIGNDKVKKNILEIASNDGTFLKPFKEAGHSVLGIDPAKNIVEMAKSNGIPTLCAFFNNDFAKHYIIENNKKFDVILARNVIAHTPNPLNFLEGINTLLSENGYAFVEFHDAFHILKGYQYDSIYHEHYSYFFLNSFSRAAQENELKVIDVIESPISGGALIVKLSKNKEHPTSSNVLKKLNQDNNIGISKKEAWLKFALFAKEHSAKLFDLVSQMSSKQKIYGYGSSARSNTMLAFSGINNNQIECIIDNSPLKQNKFTPGTRIKILSLENLPKKNCTLLLLAWNFAKEILEDLKKKGYKDIRVIQPLPNLPQNFEL